MAVRFILTFPGSSLGVPCPNYTGYNVPGHSVPPPLAGQVDQFVVQKCPLPRASVLVIMHQGEAVSPTPSLLFGEQVAGFSHSRFEHIEAEDIAVDLDRPAYAHHVPEHLISNTNCSGLDTSELMSVPPPVTMNGLLRHMNAPITLSIVTCMPGRCALVPRP